MDKRHYKIIILLAITAILPSTAYGVGIEIEETLYDLGDIVYFRACGESNELNVSVKCLPHDSLFSEVWNEKCRIYAFDSSELECIDVIINAGEGKKTAKKDLFIRNHKKALQDSSYLFNDEDLKSVAIRAYAYSLLGEYEALEDMLDILKVNRDEDRKCWPRNECDIQKTAEVLSFLSRAKVNRSRRVYHDALLWLESKQNSADYEKINISLIGEEDSECVIRVDGDKVKKFTFDENESYDAEIKYSVNQDIEAKCDDDFCLSVFDEDERVVFEECEDYNETISMYMDGGCWPANDELHCNIMLTAKILLLQGLDKDVFKEGKEWVKDNLKKGEVAGKRIKKSQDILTNIYIYNITQDDDVKTYVFFSQNNDGSFGDENKIFVTLEASRVFPDQVNTEWLSDAKDWFMAKRPSVGWENILYDAILFDIFNKGYPKITANPIIITGEEKADFKLELSKNYDIMYNLSKNIRDKITVKLTKKKDKNAYNGIATLDGKSDGYYSGDLKIFSNDSFSKQIPVILQKKPKFSMDFKEEYIFFNNTGQIHVPVDKSDSELYCDFRFSSFFDNFTKVLKDDTFLELTYTKSGGFYETVGLSYSCLSTTGVLSGEYFFDVRKYPEDPFDHRIEDHIIGAEPIKLTIYNKIKDRIVLDLEWYNDTEIYPLPSGIPLGEKEKVEIILYQSDFAEDNISGVNSITVSTMGYEANIPVTLKPAEVPHTLKGEQYEIKNSTSTSILGYVTNFNPSSLNSNVRYIGFFAIIIIVIGISVFISLTRKKTKDNKEKQEQAKPAAQPKRNFFRKKKKNVNLIEVMIAMDKTLGKKDEEIHEDLKNKGYSDKEIKKAMNKLNTDTGNYSKEKTAGDDAAETQKTETEEDSDVQSTRAVAGDIKEDSAAYKKEQEEDKLDDFSEVISWARIQANNGHGKEDLKKALLDAGYNQEDVNSITSQI